MNRIQTNHPEVLVLSPTVYGDERGWFMETYSSKACKALGINNTFLQDNMSYTAQKGTLRGLHFQNNPMAQCKLVRVVRGAVLDVAVDIRKGSPYYLRWTAVELNEENKYQLYIPRGFAHGFLTLTDNVEFVYKVDNFYSKECDRSLRFDDPDIAIDWGMGSPILSAKDQHAPLLKDCDCNFMMTDA